MSKVASAVVLIESEQTGSILLNKQASISRNQGDFKRQSHIHALTYVSVGTEF